MSSFKFVNIIEFRLQRLKEFPCLRLNSSYLQQLKFFEDYRPQVQEMFKFSSKMNKNVDKYAKTLFKYV